jgi:hypothetical protein
VSLLWDVVVTLGIGLNGRTPARDSERGKSSPDILSYTQITPIRAPQSWAFRHEGVAKPAGLAHDGKPVQLAAAWGRGEIDGPQRHEVRGRHEVGERPKVDTMIGGESTLPVHDPHPGPVEQDVIRVEVIVAGHDFEIIARKFRAKWAGALYNAAADVAAGPGTVGAMAAMSSGGGLWLARFHPEILHARMVSPIQRRQPLWDRIVVGLLLVLLSPGSAG